MRLLLLFFVLIILSSPVFGTNQEWYDGHCRKTKSAGMVYFSYPFDSDTDSILCDFYIHLWEGLRIGYSESHISFDPFEEKEKYFISSFDEFAGGGHEDEHTGFGKSAKINSVSLTRDIELRNFIFSYTGLELHYFNLTENTMLHKEFDDELNVLEKKLKLRLVGIGSKLCIADYELEVADIPFLYVYAKWCYIPGIGSITLKYESDSKENQANFIGFYESIVYNLGFKIYWMGIGIVFEVGDSNHNISQVSNYCSECPGTIRLHEEFRKISLIIPLS